MFGFAQKPLIRYFNLYKICSSYQEKDLKSSQLRKYKLNLFNIPKKIMESKCIYHIFLKS